mgnify:FL=1
MMTDGRSEDAEQTTRASQRETRKIEMTTKFDPALRTDKHILGSVIAFLFLSLAALGYSSGEYPLFVTASLLALGVFVVLLLIPYTTLREAW